MRNYSMAIMVGGLVMGAAAGASAQNLAYAAPSPKSEFVVFAEKAGNPLSPTAINTVHAAASEANSAEHITLVGRAENVASVKQELVRRGVPEQVITVRPEARAPIAKPADGLSDPIDRRVEIRF